MSGKSSVIEMRTLVKLARFLFILVLGVALYAGMKTKPVPQVVPNFDLMLHFGVFGTLAFLWLLGVSRFWRPLGLLGLLLLGAVIELWQGWVMPARTASLTDMAANGSGVLLGAFAFYCLAWFFSRQK